MKKSKFDVKIKTVIWLLFKTNVLIGKKPEKKNAKSTIA